LTNVFSNAIAILALIISIVSGYISYQGYEENSTPNIIISKENDKVAMSNEGKGVAKILKVVYSTKDNNDLKCFRELDENITINSIYESTFFSEGEPLASGKEYAILKCREDTDCKDTPYHKNYNYYVVYTNYTKNTQYYISSEGELQDEMSEKLKKLTCPKN
jgi:hypothetical protein